MNDRPTETSEPAGVYALPQRAKEARLLARLNALTAHHAAACSPYARVLDSAGARRDATTLAEVPYLAARLFKLARWQSVPDADVFKVLTSSGTTGEPSRVVLDRATAAAQSRALATILQTFLGPSRLPMLLIEEPGLAQQAAGHSARGAGAVGFSLLGRDHTYALRPGLKPDVEAIERFAERHGGGPVLLFGFTFMVWQGLLEALPAGRALFPQGILFHGGGWKKLAHRAVDRATFAARCRDVLGVTRVHDFYGMVEQVGAIFVACERGHLHAPSLADVVVRDPLTFAPLGRGEVGLIEVLSALPESYPGHAILTEDLGRLLGEDDCPCGRLGRHFEVLGRQAGAEVRGCSDTFQ
jgi:hypothetical protein